MVFLPVVFFLSGCAALLFETVWFRLAGLTLGSSVWSAALVVGACMSGLALGSALTAAFGSRVKRLLLAYATLELLVAVSGAALAFIFFGLNHAVRPILSPYLEHPGILNPLRLTIAFCLLVVPTTAMGATLPLLVKYLTHTRSNVASEGRFLWALGRLYGFNTLGAVAGSLLGELWLIEQLGIRGTALAAAGLNVVAALIVLGVRKRVEDSATTEDHTAAAEASGGLGFLAAAFFCGFSLLALEIVWFRFLVLTSIGSSLIFAVMLSIVLAGIAIGSLCSAALSARGWHCRQFAFKLSSVAAALTVAGYWGFSASHRAAQTLAAGEIERFSIAATLLMLPVCILSGMLFTALGEALRRRQPEETKAVGYLTLANTIGAVAGSTVAGFILLPNIGMENSIFCVAAMYLLTAGLVFRLELLEGDVMDRRQRVSAAAFGCCALLALVLFPFGRMQTAYYGMILSKFPEAKPIAAREGVNETSFLLRFDRLGEPFYYQLLTNGFSMSGTDPKSRRYMKLFAFLPAAIYGEPEDALMISYGTGSTARAILDLPAVRHFDVVDISRDILNLSNFVYPEPIHPLRDSRVSVHIEDGRFFLEMTGKLYDLITSEPPPPKHAGVVNLYTEEYFQLLYDHLKPGGVVTYWLPVYQLYDQETLAVTKAFCEVFADCTLWSTAGLEWMLMGTRSAPPHRDPVRFAAMWSNAKVSEQLIDIGVEAPGQIGPMFLADAAQLAALTKETAALKDNFPYRLSHRQRFADAPSALYSSVTEQAETRFLESSYIKAALPDSIVDEYRSYARAQRIITALFAPSLRNRDESMLKALSEILSGTRLVTLPIWMLGGSDQEIKTARRFLEQQSVTPGAHGNVPHLYDALGWFAHREYPNALAALRRYLEQGTSDQKDSVDDLAAYLLLQTGQQSEAAAVVVQHLKRYAQDSSSAEWRWLSAETQSHR